MNSDVSGHASRPRSRPHGADDPRGKGTSDDAVSSSESREREAAWHRGELAAREAAAGGAERDPEIGLPPADVAQRAFVALADNVRDYAICLLDPGGVITFWGEGARLIKW